MAHLNIEIKARCTDASPIRQFLNGWSAEFRGTDHQTDTYFNVSSGRLKLREGNIENNLIYYERVNEPGARESNFQLVSIPDARTLKDVLTRSIGIKVVVKKKREIYFIKNVKFHIDEVAGLGNFIEIEASNLYAEVSKEELRSQCEFYLGAFQIPELDLIDVSYSDLLLQQNSS